MAEEIKIDVLMDVNDALRKTEQLKGKIGELKKMTKAETVRLISNGQIADIEKATRAFDQMSRSVITTSQRVNELSRAMATISSPFSGAGMRSNAQKELEQTKGIFEQIGKTVKHHAQFMAGAAILGGAIAVPTEIIQTAGAIEMLSKKLEQNLELSERYHGNSELLKTDLQDLANVANIYAVGFGATLEEVYNSMQILSRRFKDPDEIAFLESLVLTISKLDNVPLEKAAENLEAVMLQFKLNARETKDFVNQFTVAVHTARINGSELLDALQRSGASFDQFNMGTKEAIAAVATLSTTTARTGSTIGNTWKSITANFSMDKAIQALDSYGIKIYEINDNGLKTMREGANVFKELQELYMKLDDEGKQALSLRIAGGKYQVNAMNAFLADANNTFNELINEMNSKATDEMTEKLLRLGLDTFQTKLLQLQASLEVLSTVIGDEVLPSLKELTDGLSNGVMWLIENKEAVKNTISALISLAEVVTAYYIQQKIANGLIAEGTVLLRTMYLLEGNFTAAFAGMGASLKAFGLTVATTCVQLAALYVAINATMALYDRVSDKSGLVGQEQDLSTQKAMIEGNRKTAIAMKDRTGLSESEINKIYDDQISDIDGKLSDVRNKIEENKTDTKLDKAQAEAEQRFKNIIDHAMASAKMPEPTMPSAIGNSDSKKENKGASKADVAEPKDRAETIKAMQESRKLDTILSNLTVTTNEYETALDTVKAKEDLFGESAETVAQKITLMSGQTRLLNEQSKDLLQYANEYDTKANDLIATNENLVGALEEQRVSWVELTAEQKKDFIQAYTGYNDTEKLLLKYIDLANKARVESSKLTKDASKLAIDTTKLSMTAPQRIYNNKIKSLELDDEHEHFKLGSQAIPTEKNAITLKNAIKQLVLAKEELKRVEGEYGVDSLSFKQQQSEVDKLTEKVEKLSDTWIDVREGMADCIADMVAEGKSFEEIWDNLWKDLAREAIYRLLQVETQQSLLGSLFGLGGASTGAFDAMGGYTSVTGFFASGGSIPGYANGGNTDGLIKGAGTGTSDSILTYLQNRGQFIKTSNGEYIMQKSAVDKYGTTMLDMINAGKYANGGKIGTDVVPYLKNPKVVQDNTSLLSADAKINREMSKQLATQNELMQQQNSMLSNMGGGNGNIVVMPVQPDANSVLKILQDNPRAVQAILGGQRKMGFR